MMDGVGGMMESSNGQGGRGATERKEAMGRRDEECKMENGMQTTTQRNNESRMWIRPGGDHLAWLT